MIFFREGVVCYECLVIFCVFGFCSFVLFLLMLIVVLILYVKDEEFEFVFCSVVVIYE